MNSTHQLGFANPAIDPVATPPSDPVTFAEATQRVITDATGGQFDGVTTYAVDHLAPV